MIILIIEITIIYEKLCDKASFEAFKQGERMLYCLKSNINLMYACFCIVRKNTRKG